MYFQYHFIVTPYSITIGNFHPEGIITISKIGVGNNRAFTNCQPVCIKAFQLIHNPTCLRSLKIQRGYTERERILIRLENKLVRESDTLFQRRARFTSIYFLSKQKEISNYNRREKLVLREILGIKSDKSIDTTQINRTILGLKTRTIIKLVAQQSIGSGIYFHHSGCGLEADQTVVSCQPQKTVLVFYNLIYDIIRQTGR